MKNKIKQLFKNENNIEVSLKDFRNYCVTHCLLIVLTVVIIILIHGINIFYNNLGIDSQVFIQYPDFDYNWEGLGRFGLLLERDLLYLNPYVSYYSGILMIVFLVLACVTMFYTFYKISGKDFGFINLCIPLICFSHPVFVEQFVFKLQCAEIGCAAFLISLATLYIFTWIKTNNYKYSIWGIILLVISFASYQAFVFIYITLCIFGFILLNEDGEKRSNFKTIVKLLVSFFISYIIYQYIIRHFFLYLNFDIRWGQDSKKKILLTIIGHIKNVLTGSGPHYNLGYLIGLAICLIIMIYKIVKDDGTKINKLWYFLSFCMLIISPFFLAISEGSTPLLRSQLALPYCEAFLIMFSTYYLFKNEYLKYISLVLIFCVIGAQMSITETFYYTDVFKNDFEIEISNQIVYDLKERGISEENTIVILGYKDPPFNSICKPGETVGLSSYNANYSKYPYYMYSTGNILGVWRCLGYDYKECSGEQAERARIFIEDKEIPKWPEEGSIVKCDDFYIIKISEDNLPW